jgi:hypothetical protein
MDEEELLTRLAEEEEMGLSYMKKCEQGIEDTVQLDLEVERLQVSYWIIVFLVGFQVQGGHWTPYTEDSSVYGGMSKLGWYLLRYKESIPQVHC